MQMNTTTRPQLELAPAPRLIDLVPRYEAYLIGDKRREQGRKGYLNGLRRFLGWLGEDATMVDLTREAVARYKEEMGQTLANQTIIQALAIIRDFSFWAINAGLRADDPTAGIRRPRRKRPDPNPLYLEEVHQLLEAIAVPEEGLKPYQRYAWERNRLAIILFLYTGARLSELAALTWAHVKLGARIIEIREGKGGVDRSVPMHPQLHEELGAVPLERRKPHIAVVGHQDGRLMSSKSFCHIFNRWLMQRLREHMGDEAFRVHAHRLRHSFASHLVWADVDLRTLQELLGHAQLSTTEHYVKVDHKRKRAAVDRLPNFGGGHAQ